MLLSFLLASAQLTAVDAERAFARDAQRIGQWTAFRKYAHPDAVMFTPQTVWAHEFLKDRKDPPKSVTWQPARSIVSCDGRTAVNVGPWQRPNAVGYFTTVWHKDKGRWLWSYDGGDALKTPMSVPRKPAVVRASCRGKPTGAPVMAPPPISKRAGSAPPDDFGRGHSADKTLGWDWKVGPKGERTFRVFLWDGGHYRQALYQQIAGE